MTRPSVLLSRRLPKSVEHRLRALFDVRLNERDVALTARDFTDAMRSVDALVPTVGDRITADILSAEPMRVRIIANFGVGVDHIALDAAHANGIVVTNTPGVLTNDTADLTIALLLMTARRLGEGERELRAGRWTGWRPTHLLGARVTGATLGVIGMGRIGRAVARRAREGLGMRVIYFNPSPVTDDVGEARDSVDAVVAECDVLTLHCPSTPETRHLMDARRIGLMRPSAMLINTARGDLVDELALADALRRGALAGAGLDVHEHEPSITPGLLELTSVVLLPHLGSATLETRTAMGERVIANLVAFFEGAPPPDVVTVAR